MGGAASKTAVGNAQRPTAKDRWQDVRWVSKNLACFMDSADLDVSRVFKAFATKKTDASSNAGFAVLESQHLNNALAALGTPIDQIDKSILDPFSGQSSLDFKAFREVAEKAIRWRFIASVVNGASVHAALSPLLPNKIENILVLDESRIQEVLRSDAFVQSATDEILKSLANHREQQRKVILTQSESNVLATENTTDIKQVMSKMDKYHSQGGFMSNFGDKKMFEGGLEVELGLADPSILRAVLHEHISAQDSEKYFVSSNYGIETTPLQEFSRLLGSDCAMPFLQRISGHSFTSDPHHRKGPTMDELRQLRKEFDRLAQTFDSFSSLRSGIFPGEVGDTCMETLVEIEIKAHNPEHAQQLVQDMDDSLKILTQGIQAAWDPNSESCKPVELALPAVSIEECVRMTFSFPIPEKSRKVDLPITDATLRLVEVCIRQVLKVEETCTIKVQVSGQRTYCYCEFGDEKALEKALSSKTHTELKSLAEKLAPNPKFLVAKKSARKLDNAKDCIAVIVREFKLETEEWKKQNKFRRQARRRLTLSELMTIPEVEKAELRVEEAIVVYQYTGPLFQKWNAVLRHMPFKEFQENRYTTTIHTLVSAVHKLSKHTKVPVERKVYRGLGGMVLDKRWFEPDQRGARGGVELGFLSTTLNKDVALQYSGVSKKRGTIFEIEVGSIHCGALLDYISQYPGEGELVFGPLSFLEVVGDPRLDIFDGEQVVSVKLRISINMKAMTIEEMVGKRKRFQVEMMENLIREIIFDATSFMDESKTFLSNDRISESLAAVEKMLEEARKKDASFFNKDENFRKSWNDALDLKNESIVQWWFPLLLESVTAADFQKMLTSLRERYTQKAVARVATRKAQLMDLIERSIDETADDGQTPLMRQIQGGNENGVRILIAAEVDIFAKDKNAENAMRYCVGSCPHALLKGRGKIIGALVEASADINERDEQGNTPLHDACSKSVVEIVQSLLAAKAEINCRDRAEQTPLHRASKKGKLEILKELIASKADIFAKDKGGDDALYWAGNDECRAALQDAVNHSKR